MPVCRLGRGLAPSVASPAASRPTGTLKTKGNSCVSSSSPAWPSPCLPSPPLRWRASPLTRAASGVTARRGSTPTRAPSGAPSLAIAPVTTAPSTTTTRSSTATCRSSRRAPSSRQKTHRGYEDGLASPAPLPPTTQLSPRPSPPTYSSVAEVRGLLLRLFPAHAGPIRLCSRHRYPAPPHAAAEPQHRSRRPRSRAKHHDLQCGYLATGRDDHSPTQGVHADRARARAGYIALTGRYAGQSNALVGTDAAHCALSGGEGNRRAAPICHKGAQPCDGCGWRDLQLLCRTVGQ